MVYTDQMCRALPQILFIIISLHTASEPNILNPIELSTTLSPTSFSQDHLILPCSATAILHFASACKYGKVRGVQ